MLCMPQFAMSINISPPKVASYVAIGLTILLSSALLRWIRRGILGEIYWLHHAILNIDVPPKTTWMNMGYWDVSKEQSLET